MTNTSLKDEDRAGDEGMKDGKGLMQRRGIREDRVPEQTNFFWDNRDLKEKRRRHGG